MSADVGIWAGILGVQPLQKDFFPKRNIGRSPASAWERNKEPHAVRSESRKTSASDQMWLLFLSSRLEIVVWESSTSLEELMKQIKNTPNKEIQYLDFWSADEKSGDELFQWFSTPRRSQRLSGPVEPHCEFKFAPLGLRLQNVGKMRVLRPYFADISKLLQLLQLKFYKVMGLGPFYLPINW